LREIEETKEKIQKKEEYRLAKIQQNLSDPSFHLWASKGRASSAILPEELHF